MSHKDYIDPQKPFEVDRIAFDKGISKADCGFTVFLDKDGKHIKFKYMGDDPNYTHTDQMTCTEKLVIEDVPIDLETIHQRSFGYPFTEIFPQEKMKCKINFTEKVTEPPTVRDIYSQEIICFRGKFGKTDKERSPKELVQDFKKLKKLSRDIRQEIERRKR